MFSVCPHLLILSSTKACVQSCILRAQYCELSLEGGQDQFVHEGINEGYMYVGGGRVYSFSQDQRKSQVCTMERLLKTQGML